jgi:hypothetical protein
MLKKLVFSLALVTMIAPITACDEDPTAPSNVASADITVGVTAPIAAAIVGTSFSFPAGAGALDASVAGQNLAVTFGGTAAATTANIVITSPTGAAVGTFTANMQFGSCIFVVASSSFPAGHRLAQGQTVTVNPCNIRLGTQGAPADSVARSRAAVFILGGAASTGSTVTVTVNPGGSVTVNGASAGTVTLVPVSG